MITIAGKQYVARYYTALVLLDDLPGFEYTGDDGQPKWILVQDVPGIAELSDEQQG